jgi:hypothetical protein
VKHSVSKTINSLYLIAYMKPHLPILLLLILTPLLNGNKPFGPDTSGPEWKALWQDDFVQLNCKPETFQFRKEEKIIHCTGRPSGGLRTAKSYRNLEIVVEWRHLRYAGNSGLFVWSPKSVLDKLKPGQLPQGIEIQVLDLGYEERWLKNKGKPSDWFTSHGDVFPVGVARMKPFPPVAPNGTRSFPSKRLSKGVNEWNHYYIKAVDGVIRLSVNGEEVSGGKECHPSEGFVCLESEGSPVDFRGLKIRELK